MIKILYLGKNYLDVIDRIPKDKEYIILDLDEYSKINEDDFIKYVDNLDDMYHVHNNVKRIMIKKGVTYEKSLLRDYLIVDDFNKKLPPFKKIGIYGNKELVVRFIKFLASYYKCGFKIKTGSWKREFFIEESLLNVISSYKGQIDLQKDGLIDLLLDDGDADINIFLWDGRVEDIYKWKSLKPNSINVLISNKFFSIRKVKEKWMIKTYYMNKYNIKKVWESICYYYNML